VTRLVDIVPDARYGVPVDLTLGPQAEEMIEILELTYDVVRVREVGSAPLLDWRFENTYWASRDNGFVWKSVQHLVPELGPVELEILKKAA